MRRDGPAWNGELLAPLGIARGEARAARLGELAQQPVGLAEPAERPADAGREVLAEDGACRAVRGTHAQVWLEGHDSGREAREDDRQVGTLGLRRLLRALLVLACAPQPLGHVVERVHQEAHLVVRRERQARVEVALRDGARALDQVLDRLHQPLRGKDRAVPRGEQRKQQHDGERQDETRLERLAQVVLLAELLVGGLYRVGQCPKPLGDGIDRLHHQPTASRPLRRERDGGAHAIAALGLRLQAHERPALPHLHQHFARHLVRHHVGREALAHRDDRAALGGDRDLERAGLAAQLLEQPGRFAAGDGELVGDQLRGVELLAHARLERGTGQHQRVVEALADLDVEPAVDAAVQELHREEVHEQDRQRGQHAEDPHHARLEARADHVPAPVAHQLRELGAEQAHQHHQAGHVDHQDPRVPAAELLGVLRRLCHEQDRGQPQQAAHADHDRRCGALQRRSVHAYHSLVALQSSVQNSSQLSVSGALRSVSTARTRNS